MLNYKKQLLLPSLLTLLPIPIGLALWNRFPEKITTHWNLAGQADGFSSIAWTVFVPPVLMLLTFWVCVLVTMYDKGNRGRNHKPLKLVLWIVPLLSNLSSGIMYALALGMEFSPEMWFLVPMGLMFAAIGNYMPKMKMNATMGIKVPWAYSSEENWNATHRFGGRVWVIGGLASALGGLIGGGFGTTLFILAMVAATVLPIVYSYRYYRMQKARGDALNLVPPGNPMARKLSSVFLVLLLIFVGMLMFTGDIEVRFGETSFTIEASFYDDLTVDYDAIEALEYREVPVPGTRVGGFGSFRLLMGFFSNEEFGNHTRYTYYDPDSCIILTTASRTLVLSGKTAQDTMTIYQTLLEKIK